MKVCKKVLSILMITALVIGMFAMNALSADAASTGVGLAEWAMRGYREGWVYVWGGSSPGGVDCSGLIWSYCGGDRTSMLADAQANGRDWGYVSDGIPNVHGLGLSRPGHVGVYIGNGMEIDSRSAASGVVLREIGYGNNWNCWFKLTAVSYPTTGWQRFNGDDYYYENGEYLTDTTRTIDGVTYYFDYAGVSSAIGSTENSGSDDTSSAVAADDGMLKKGSTGTRVADLQARLLELGYYDGAVDGDFGAMTEKAFKLFQKQVGLYEDGIAGNDAEYLFADDAPAYVPAETSAAITEDVRTSTKRIVDLAETGTADDSVTEDADQTEEAVYLTEAAEPEVKSYANGDSGDTVVTIQERLITLGYLDGVADGIFGNKTEAAVKQFQSLNTLDQTGVVDTATYDALLSDAAVKNTSAESAEDAAPIAASIAATTAKDTTVERANAAQSQRSVAVISESVSSRASSTANFEFIVWLGIMIAVMLIAFVIVFMIEKKRSRAMAYAGRRFQ